MRPVEDFETETLREPDFDGLFFGVLMGPSSLDDENLPSIFVQRVTCGTRPNNHAVQRIRQA